MKRSEIVKLIENYYMSKYMNKESFNASELLSKLEKAGMKSPIHTIETTFDDLTLFKTIEGWEPE